MSQPPSVARGSLVSAGVLSSYDRRRFNDIVAGLLAEDPEFGAHSDPPPPRELPPRPGLALTLWLSMPFLVALGGWTGFLVAVVACAYGMRLMSRGRVLGDHPERLDPYP
jgi:hypothetical protein